METTDTLVLDLVLLSSVGECCGPFYQTTNVAYNGELQEIIEKIYGFEKITIIK